MEEMVMMMTVTNSEKLKYQTIPEPVSTTTLPSWKLYENPFYCSRQQHHRHHRLHLPLSARRIAASFWDISFLRPSMDSELDIARARIIELKAELEFERKVRKKVESMNKRLAKEVSEERQGRHALERVCEEMEKEIASDKEEIDRMKKDMEEERRMLRMAEVLREERVQMKLAEAKILFEEKLLQLEVSKEGVQMETSASKREQTSDHHTVGITTATCDSPMVVVNENSACHENNSVVHSATIQRRASPEAENPHIKRGIKGFVEFPRVIRAIGSRSKRLGSKLECQKAQLRLLLRQKSPVRTSNLIMG